MRGQRHRDDFSRVLGLNGQRVKIVTATWQPPRLVTNPLGPLADEAELKSPSKKSNEVATHSDTVPVTASLWVAWGETDSAEACFKLVDQAPRPDHTSGMEIRDCGRVSAAERRHRKPLGVMNPTTRAASLMRASIVAAEQGLLRVIEVREAPSTMPGP